MNSYLELEINQKGACFLAHRIREIWNRSRELFATPIEVDEMHVDRMEKNIRESKKQHVWRGVVGKTPVTSAKDHESNHAYAEVVPDTTATTLTTVCEFHFPAGVTGIH